MSESQTGVDSVENEYPENFKMPNLGMDEEVKNVLSSYASVQAAEDKRQAEMAAKAQKEA